MAKPLSEYVTYIIDQLQDFGDCTAKPMFGCYGIYYQDLCFAIIYEDELYIKADDLNREEFIGLQPFIYKTVKKTMTISYYAMTETTVEDQQELANWAKLGYESALRAPKKKKKSSQNLRTA